MTAEEVREEKLKKAEETANTLLNTAINIINQKLLEDDSDHGYTLVTRDSIEQELGVTLSQILLDKIEAALQKSPRKYEMLFSDINQEKFMELKIYKD